MECDSPITPVTLLSVLAFKRTHIIVLTITCNLLSCETFYPRTAATFDTMRDLGKWLVNNTMRRGPFERRKRGQAVWHKWSSRYFLMIRIQMFRCISPFFRTVASVMQEEGKCQPKQTLIERVQFAMQEMVEVTQ